MEPLLSNAERHAASNPEPSNGVPSYEETRRDVSPTRSELAVAWWIFWLLAWAGTTLGGGLFGLLLGGVVALVGLANSSPEALLVPFVGFGFGVVWAGGVGLLVVPTLGILAWTFWLQKRPRLLAAIAGALTGLISMPFLFMLTMPVGALTAWGIVNRFLKSRYGERLLAMPQPQPSIPNIAGADDASIAFDDVPQEAQTGAATADGPLHFSIFDLLLRMSGFAVLITLWMSATELFKLLTGAM